MREKILKSERRWLYLIWFGLFAFLITFIQLKRDVQAKGVDVERLKQLIEKDRSGLPPDLEEKPLIAKSLYTGSIPVYSDSDLIEQVGVADGATLTVTATDASKYALFCEYESDAGDGMGWIAIKNFIVDPEYENGYATVRKMMPVYKDKKYSKESKILIGKYTGIIIVSEVGKKHQVIYSKKDHYGLGWMKQKHLDNTLEYDGRPKQILLDGTYNLYSKKNNDGKKVYAEDTQAQKLIFVHYRDDNYYLINEKGQWLGEDTLSNKKKQSVTYNDTDMPMYDGLFKVTRASDGYHINNELTGHYLGLTAKGKLALYAKDQGAETMWRITSPGKMIDMDRPMVITQYDAAWCGKPYGTDDITGCIGAAGCGLLAPTNAVYALTGQYMDVMDLADFAVEKGYRVIGSGTTDAIFKGIAKTYGERYGFAWDGSSNKIADLVEKLNKGDVAVSHVQGHYVAIVACSKDAKEFLLLDSNRLPKRETSAFGDWVSRKRLEEGALSSTGYFFYKPFDGKKVIEKKVVKKKVKQKKDKKK